ncbi:MAG TPA: NAD(P)/FAD-dependent oxidoreductase [Caulobacteraceae bacterium]
MSAPRVVIVGAGFAGLQAARGLAHAAAEVVVVDAHNHHTFQPLLYQVATAALSPAEIAWPIRHLLKRQANARVLLARATGVDVDARQLITDEGPIAYDQLVIAAGASHAYFGHDDWAPFAPGLKSLEDALAIRRRILSAFEHAELAGAQAPAALTTFVVVGGGPTGVEMAGAIAEIARDALRSEFRHIDPAAARVILVEAGPRLLPAFPEGLGAVAARRLARYGVEVITGRAVTAIDAKGVALDGEHIAAAVRVWAAGVRASPQVAGLPGPHDRAGRARVGPDLALADHPEILVIGDGAVVLSDGRPVPGVAPAAKQMGAYAARVIAARLAGRAAPPPFRYRHAGDLATIGRGAAVVRLAGGVQLTGLIGWLFWGFVHIYFLISLRARFFVALDWLWSYVTYHRGARLITGD